MLKSLTVTIDHDHLDATEVGHDELARLHEITGELITLATGNVPLQGTDWQNWANQLLTEHYGPTDYVKVPDTEGDGGIEGFTRRAGHAYQAYGAESYKTGKALYEAQRNKMTSDIKKFIDNRKLLSKLFGATKISCWVLIVPRIGLKDILSHSNQKTKEVLAAELPYVAEDFHVHICDEEHFATERDKLLSYKYSQIAIATESPDTSTVNSWMSSNDGLIVTLDDKLSRIPLLTTDKLRRDFRQKVLVWHLEGQNLLEELRGHSPTAFENVFQVKTQYEKTLGMLQVTSTDS